METVFLKNTIGFLLGHTCREMKNTMTKAFSEAGLNITSEQWHLLMSLWAKDGRGQNELISFVIKEKTTVTRLIDGLEKRNLIYRVNDRHDRRKKHVFLTQEGKELKQKVMPVAVATMEKTVEGLEIQEIEILKTLLNRVLENLNKI